MMKSIHASIQAVLLSIRKGVVGRWLKLPASPAQSQLPVPVEAAGRPVLKQSSRITRHLSQSILLEESGTAPMIRFTMLACALACMAFFIWSALTQLDEVANGEGEVVPIGLVKTVQHLEGGLVEKVLVTEGQMVDEGAPILKMSPAAALSDLDQTRAREMALMLKSERLRAFTEGRKPDFSFAAGYDALISDNLAIFQTQTNAYQSARSVIQSQLEQKRTDVHTLETQQEALFEQLAALDQVMRMKDQLVAKGLTSRINYFDARREQSRMQGELTRTISQTQTAVEAFNEIQKRLQDQHSSSMKQAMDDLGQTIAELAQTQESIARMEDRVNRLVVSSPVRGYIKGLTVKNSGAVIQPGGQICEVVPMDQEMAVDAKISPRDIGYVKVDQEVKVKVASFDFARFGYVPGKVQVVSASSFMTERGEPFFKVRVRLERNYVGNIPGEHMMMPGMTVTSEIITGTKSLLQYMLKPIFSQVKQSFHER